MASLVRPYCASACLPDVGQPQQNMLGGNVLILHAFGIAFCREHIRRRAGEPYSPGPRTLSGGYPGPFPFPPQRVSLPATLVTTAGTTPVLLAHQG